MTDIKYPFLNLKAVNASFAELLKLAANRVIDSGRYIGGDECEAFEQELAAATGTPYAVGVSNGLDALRLIFRAYIEMGRIAPGDEVIVSANTYIASVLAVTDNGLTPVFVEPDAQTMNIDSRLIENAVTPRTRAILTVHLYGKPAYDTTMADVARRYNLLIIEDNAQAIGAKCITRSPHGTDITGSLGDAAALSFYPTKNLGALGDAGAVTTFDADLADAVRALANYGSDRRYHNIYQGYNCRLDPIQAAFLREKLPFLPIENMRRSNIAAIYNAEIDNPLIAKPLYGIGDVWHQYVVQAQNRLSFLEHLTRNGVGYDIHYAVPPHRQPCYTRYSSLSLPITDALADSVVSLPISVLTTNDDAHEIAAIINDYTI